MKTPLFVQRHHEDHDAVRAELLQGLRAPQAHTSPKYLYDALGSRLFEAITELPEYYPTRTEAAIFSAHGAAMAACAPSGATLIDLGAGNCAKAARLFGLLAPRRYVAVDISVEFLRGALSNLQHQYPQLDMVGLGLDFSAGLTLPPETGAPGDGQRVLFYPGSSIGNFTPDEALAFLRSVRGACGPVAGSGLLIGVDLVKAKAELEAAYDDALGVTAAFNRNLLPHINRLAGTDFALADWRHVALYDDVLARIEMHLQAVRPATVRWPGGKRAFAAGERIHTENSYKWTLPRFAQLLQDAGFASHRHWTDDDARFAVFWAAC
ncbi:MAG: L-histidine N(alpha)-methyltransferase [Ramlibacter sp.]